MDASSSCPHLQSNTALWDNPQGPRCLENTTSELQNCQNLEEKVLKFAEHLFFFGGISYTWQSLNKCHLIAKP